MDLQLKDKVIVITGGAKGIGLGIATVLSEEGAIPVIVGRNKKNNVSAIQELEKKGLRLFEVTAELTDPQECRKAVDEVISNFGRIEGLVNNAGVNDGTGLESGGYEKFMLSLHRNLIHYYMMAQFALPELIK